MDEGRCPGRPLLGFGPQPAKKGAGAEQRRRGQNRL